MGRYQVPCEHGPVSHVFELSGDRSPRGTAFADWVHPIDITAALPELRGIRSDVESVNATLKQHLPRQKRAGSLRPHDFLVDIVGGALWINAIAWDVHAAHHTRAGVQEHQKMLDEEERASRFGSNATTW
jgi:hypothetical protein